MMPMLNSSSPVVRDEAPPALDVDLSLFREDFRNEARAYLSAMWTFADAANLAAVEGAARAAMMGYSDIGELAAHAEHLLLDMRDGKIGLDPIHLDTLRDLAQRVGQIVEVL